MSKPKRSQYEEMLDRWENGVPSAPPPEEPQETNKTQVAPPAQYAMPMGEPTRVTAAGTEADNTRTGLTAAPPKNDSPAAVEAIDLTKVVDSPFQPRKRQLNKKETEDLARLIAAAGQTTPIIVTPGTGELEGNFIVHSGHRRCAALRLLAWPTVKAIVRRDLTERDARKLALTDNLGREDLSAYEQAIAFRDYCAAYELDATKAAEELGISRRQGSRFQAIANASEELLQILRDEAVPFYAAEPLVRIDGKNPRAAVRLAKRFTAGAMSVAGLEAEASGGTKARPMSAEAPAVQLKVTAKGVQFSAKIGRELSDEQRAQVRDALATFLAHAHISSVTAAELPAEGAA
jgi:ParB/RepB/Spo0J family partition protein